MIKESFMLSKNEQTDKELFEAMQLSSLEKLTVFSNAVLQNFHLEKFSFVETYSSVLQKFNGIKDELTKIDPYIEIKHKKFLNRQTWKETGELGIVLDGVAPQNLGRVMEKLRSAKIVVHEIEEREYSIEDGKYYTILVYRGK